MGTLFAPKMAPVAPSLSIFQPGEETPAVVVDPRSFTLREAFNEYLRPSVPKKSTLAEYKTSLRHWERNSQDPPVGSIDTAVMGCFLAELENRGLGAETRAKIGRHLRAILRR